MDNDATSGCLRGKKWHMKGAERLTSIFLLLPRNTKKGDMKKLRNEWYVLFSANFVYDHVV